MSQPVEGTRPSTRAARPSTGVAQAPARATGTARGSLVTAQEPASSPRPAAVPAAATPAAEAPAPTPTVPRSAVPARPAPTTVPTGRKGKRRHARVVIRKVGPWSVFKISLIFYTCLMLVVLGAMVILYGTLGAIGALDSVTKLIRELFADENFTISGRWLFTRGLGIGLAMVVLWSIINVFVVFLYNLISDLVGGVEVTLAERR